MLIILGLTLAAWSRRCLGHRLPGATAYLIFLMFYLNLDFASVAERDWHATLCIVLGLLVLEAWPGRASRVISALLTALSLAIRPHVVLFLPALWSAVGEGADRKVASPIEPGAHNVSVRYLVEWSLVFVAFVAIVFAPLWIAGIAGDLARGLKVVAVGGPYNRNNPATIVRVFMTQLGEPATLIQIGLLVLTLVACRAESRHRAATWALALTAAMFYSPFHPAQHFYLIFPVMLVGSVSLAIPIGWIMERASIAPTLRVIALLVVFSEMRPKVPRFCDPVASVAAIHSLASGDMLPAWRPPGSGNWYNSEYARAYDWKDYRRVLIHLRQTTGPATLVANVLKEPPFPAINGPVGRLCPFRAESGLCWMYLVDIDLEPEFVAELERSADSVVVWSPTVPPTLHRLELDRLTDVILRHYQPEVRFGRIEVWRRIIETR